MTVETNESHQAPAIQQNGKNICFKVGKSLYCRLGNHIRALKHLGRHGSKNDWMVDAIREKLSRETETVKDIPEQKAVNISVDPALRQALEKRVHFIKKFIPKYSAKKWIIEALHEKLEKEELAAKDLAEQR